MTGIYEYVSHSRVKTYLAKGWTLVSDLKGTHHGHWSVLMKAPDANQ